MSRLTRGYTGSSSAGGGITEGQHEVLDTLVHKIAEDSYVEFLYTGKDLTSVIVWTSVAKTLKIRETTLTYTGKDVTGITIVQYDGVGATVNTLTKTLTYTGKDLTSISVTKT